MSQVKTLAEILAQVDKAPDAKSGSATPTTKKRSETIAQGAFVLEDNNKTKSPTKIFRSKQEFKKKKRSNSVDDDSEQDFHDNSEIGLEIDSPKPIRTQGKKKQKRFHPAATFIPEKSETPDYEPPNPNSIKALLAEVKNDLEKNNLENGETEENNQDADNIPAALKAYLRSPEQRQAKTDAIKAESRLRWLAFYYLSRREFGQAELKQKLIEKEQDPDKIDALLAEFSEKGYQSDERATLMLIRENIRKGRGRNRIKQELQQKTLTLPSNIDELIELAQAESQAFSEFMADDDELVEGVDWLKLAVTARTKKYGDSIPTTPKDKAKQLRFLQYRGFQTDICFAALDYTLETLDERY